MTQYRKPTAADIGKTVEFNCPPSDEWHTGELEGSLTTHQHRRGTGTTMRATVYESHNARIPVTTAADELLVAADMCADHSFDLAAAILRGGVECDRVRELMIYAGMEPGDFRNACDRTHEAPTT